MSFVLPKTHIFVVKSLAELQLLERSSRTSHELTIFKLGKK